MTRATLNRNSVTLTTREIFNYETVATQSANIRVIVDKKQTNYKGMFTSNRDRESN